MSTQSSLTRGAGRRLARVSTLVWGMPLRMVWARLRGLFASSARRQALLDECHETNAARALETMGQMKGAMMKLAQMVSYVSDDVPEAYRDQLAILQASAPAMDFDVIAVELERELGASLEALFADIDPNPLAAASIGQVHRADRRGAARPDPRGARLRGRGAQSTRLCRPVRRPPLRPDPRGPRPLQYGPGPHDRLRRRARFCVASRTAR